MPVESCIIETQMKELGLVGTFGTKKEVRELPNIIVPGEKIYGMASGSMEGSTWLITVTDRRVILLDKGLLYGLKLLELPISQIKSVTHKTGMLLGEILIDTGGQTKKLENMVKADAPKIAALVSSLVHKGIAATASLGLEEQDNLVDKLERLAALKEKGLLSDEEFAAGKRKLLGG